MYKWEKLFDSVALARARAIDPDRITLTKRDETHIDAAVLSMGRTEVFITLKDHTPYIMKCKCPKARSGRKCEHMAAVLYKLEEVNAPKKAVPPVSEKQKTAVKEPAAQKQKTAVKEPVSEKQKNIGDF